MAQSSSKSTSPEQLERNKAVVREILNAFNTGDTSVIPRLLHPDIVSVMPMHGMEEQINLPTMSRVQQEIINDHTAFPDTEFTEDDIMAEGDRVILRWSMTGTKAPGP